MKTTNRVCLHLLNVAIILNRTRIPSSIKAVHFLSLNMIFAESSYLRLVYFRYEINRRSDCHRDANARLITRLIEDTCLGGVTLATAIVVNWCLDVYGDEVLPSGGFECSDNQNITSGLCKARFIMCVTTSIKRLPKISRTHNTKRYYQSFY